MNMLFVGREKEQQRLREYLNSSRSEFIAVYGRRRVGKTYLIQHVVGTDYVFYAAGMNNVSMHIQLQNFMQGIRKHRPDVPVAKNWLDAFIALESYLDSLPEGRKIVFIDEMPWLDTPQSNFISGLEHFWNSWASWRDDVKLIVCGSATSWILNNLIKNRGGLHNRVTHKMLLKPFSLKECKNYFEESGFHLSNRQIAECYMVLGGVPFYLSKMNRGEGVAQNIDRLIFDEEGELHDEFHSLYNSLYKNAVNHIKIVTALATKGRGLTRREILSKTKLPDNGKFSLMLEELESCGFIRSYEPYLADHVRRRRMSVEQRVSSNTLFQLVDHFTLFHFQVMRRADARDSHYWSNSQHTHDYPVWCGLSFEMLCLNHIEQIKKALGISGINANVFSWFGKGENRAAQIDLLIDRADNTINICEMKFWSKPYAMTEDDERDIERKISAFTEATSTDKQLIVTMITTKGIEHNEHSETVQRELTLDDLFL